VTPRSATMRTLRAQESMNAKLDLILAKLGLTEAEAIVEALAIDSTTDLNAPALNHPQAPNRNRR
jgi:hypothetical protein